MRAIPAELPEASGQGAFVFTTGGESGTGEVAEDHRRLRDTMVAKVDAVVDGFACEGFNTSSILRHLGGVNRGRPSGRSPGNAEGLARRLSGGHGS